MLLAIAMDLLKAFDSLNHRILLKKLESYGIIGLALGWVHSYLDKRPQSTRIDQIYSCTRYITCGVPQGSILGPLLFLIYINDITNSISSSKLIIYADDCTCLFTAKTHKQAVQSANSELSVMSDWFKANKLSLNLNKIKGIFFSKSAVPILENEISIGDTAIELVLKIK